MPSLYAHMMNYILKRMPADPPGVPHDYAKERARNASRRLPRTPKGVTVEDIDLNGIHAEKISKAGNGDVLVLYIHGGGFTTGSARERRALCLYITGKLGFNCISPDYRLAPEHKFPAALEDCFQAYCSILDLGYDPAKIILMGESAGGTLVLSLALKLQDQGQFLPALLAVLSPLTTVADDLPSHKDNIKTDSMIHQDPCNPALLQAYLNREDQTPDRLRNPLISPYYGDYTHLPPIFFSASDSEVLYDDSRLLFERLKAEGHDVVMETQRGVCHAYPIFPDMPESKKTLATFRQFVGNRSGRIYLLK